MVYDYPYFELTDLVLNFFLNVNSKTFDFIQKLVNEKSSLVLVKIYAYCYIFWDIKTSLKLADKTIKNKKENWLHCVKYRFMT